MAGDWIKMRTNLDDDPRVIEIAFALETTELHIVGCLWKIWAWADSHSLDGNAIRVTTVTLDRFVRLQGFAEVLRKVGWLEGRDGALTFPRFSEHNGQTAKKRAETKDRVAKHRQNKAEKCNADTVTDVTPKVLPEKRREEKNKDTTYPTPKSPKGTGRKSSKLSEQQMVDLIDPDCDYYSQAAKWAAYKAERPAGERYASEKSWKIALGKMEGYPIDVLDEAIDDAISGCWKGWEHNIKHLRKGKQANQSGEFWEPHNEPQTRIAG